MVERTLEYSISLEISFPPFLFLLASAPTSSCFYLSYAGFTGTCHHAQSLLGMFLPVL